MIDSLPLDDPADDTPLWGARTRRALRTFANSNEHVAPELIHALAQVKLAGARANVEIGALGTARGEAIEAAARELLAGRHAGQFPLTMWQSAAAVQTNANVDEVIARRASVLLDAATGLADAIDPAKEVGLGHGAEDAVPSAMHVAAMTLLNHRLLPVVARLRGTLAAKSNFYRDVEAPSSVAAGPRTHGMRARRATLGQVIGAFETQLALAQRAIEGARPPLLELPIGARTDEGLRTEFAGRACAALARETGHAFRPAGDRFASLGSAGALVALHGALKILAVTLAQIAHDVEGLALDQSQGDADDDEDLAADEAASRSDVEPAMCEALTMIGAQVIGNDAALSAGTPPGGAAAQPLIAHAVLQSLRLLADGIAGFDAHLMRGLAVRSAPAPGERLRAALAAGREGGGGVAAGAPSSVGGGGRWSTAAVAAPWRDRFG
jgi:fumarate hydratase class II